MKTQASIRRCLEEAIGYADGSADPALYRIHASRTPDVRDIRHRLGMTQEEFAQLFGFSIHTLRHWEQGKRVPEGPTRAYLVVIGHDPMAVRRALEAA